MNLRPLGRPAASALLLLASLGAVASERPFEEKMREFENHDAVRRNEPGGIVFVGSSSIRLWDLPASFGAGADFELTGPILNRGFGGSHLSHSVDQIDLLVLKHKPRLVVVYAGDNDVNSGKSAERVSSDFDRFVSLIHRALPDTRIAYIAIKPSLARWKLADTMRDANGRIQRRCSEDSRLRFLDIWTPMLGADGRPREGLFVDDGLHLNEAGYRVWAGVIHDALNRD